MMDSEQVIKALEKHLNNLDCDECPYWNTCHDYNNDDVVSSNYQMHTSEVLRDVRKKGEVGW